MKVFKNKIVNRLWELLPGFMVWELWKTRNSQIFENKTQKKEEIWPIIEAHLKETITLHQWTQEHFIAEEKKRIILYELEIVELPINNALIKMAPTSINNVNTWTKPPKGSFKFNFYGAAKGNPGPAGFGGALSNSDGIILSML